MGNGIERAIQQHAPLTHPSVDGGLRLNETDETIVKFTNQATLLLPCIHQLAGINVSFRIGPP